MYDGDASDTAGWVGLIAGRVFGEIRPVVVAGGWGWGMGKIVEGQWRWQLSS